VDGVETWVAIPFRITFPTAENTLDDQQRALLREVVRTLQARGDVRRIRIEGHTDNRGGQPLNQRLSEDRARTVLEYLVSLGVPREGLEAVGYGSTRPLTDESSDMDRAQDRRVEFSILVVIPHGTVVPGT
jgi:outer membrane protein OmpA-like peptidoglycan-associated protein